MSNRSGNLDVYVMKATGGNARQLTTYAAEDGAPRWSPDGSRIAFFSGRDGNFEVYVMSVDGSGKVNVTNDPASDSSPSWSPDGTRIAFVSNRFEDRSLILIANADGSNPERLMTDRR